MRCYLFSILIVSFIASCASSSLLFADPIDKEENNNPRRVEGISSPQSSDTSLLKKLPIDLETTIRLTEANNLDIALAREAVKAAKAQAILAHERFVPTINPGFRFYRLEGETQGTEGEFVNVDKQNIFGGAEVTLKWEFGDALFNSLSTEKQYEAAKSELGSASRRNIKDAAILYYQLLRFTAETLIAEEALRVASEELQDMETAFKAGKTFEVEVIRARWKVSAVRLDLSRARLAKADAALRLSFMLHLRRGVELEPVEKLVPVQLVKPSGVEEVVTQALKASPEVRASEFHLAASKIDKAGSVWGPLVPNIQTQVSNGEFGETLGSSQSQTVFQVALGWRLGPGGVFDVGKQKAAEASYRMAEIELMKVKETVTTKVLGLIANISEFSSSLTTAKIGLKDAEQALKLSIERRKAGVGVPLEVIQAEEALSKAQLSYINIVTDYNVAQFSLFADLGEESVS